jgi:hypothetical protein
MNVEQRERNTVSWPHCGQVNNWAIVSDRVSEFPCPFQGQAGAGLAQAAYRSGLANPALLRACLPGHPVAGAPAAVQSINDGAPSVKKLNGSARPIEHRCVGALLRGGRTRDLLSLERHFSHLPDRILYRTMLSDSTFVQRRRLNIMKSQRNFD